MELFDYFPLNRPIYLQPVDFLGELRLDKRQGASAEREDMAEIVQIQVGEDFLVNLEGKIGAIHR